MLEKAFFPFTALGITHILVKYEQTKQVWGRSQPGGAL